MSTHVRRAWASAGSLDGANVKRTSAIRPEDAVLNNVAHQVEVLLLFELSTYIVPCSYPRPPGCERRLQADQPQGGRDVHLAGGARPPPGRRRLRASWLPLALPGAPQRVVVVAAGADEGVARPRAGGAAWWAGCRVACCCSKLCSGFRAKSTPLQRLDSETTDPPNGLEEKHWAARGRI